MNAEDTEVTQCVLIATGLREPAERAARAAGLAARLVLSKGDCARSLSAARGQARREGIRTLAIHSRDWDRQELPQLFELAAARLGLPDRRIVDDAGDCRVLSRALLAGRVASVPAQAAAGVSGAAIEGMRLAVGSRRRSSRRAVASRATERAVLAVWRGLRPTTAPGGSVTHVSGILGGFRAQGMLVALLTTSPPPPQLAAVVDELAVVPPLPPRLRLTTEISDISANRFERSHGRRLIERLQPDFIYMRADPFVTSGVDLAARTGLPVVLEWNSSAVWTRANWQEQRRIKAAWDPVLRTAERYVLQRSDVVAAVSEHAAAMAMHAGASAERVIVVPNGVDLAAVDRARERAGGSVTDRGDGTLLGWVGSFGPWHGAEVLVEALAALPGDVRARLVGDGMRRPHAQELARRLGVDERIEWTGSLPHEQAVAQLAACDLLVSPHVPLEGQPFFGSPTKLFEYMAIGRPIVASSLAQIGEVLEDGRTAQLVTPGDPRDLAEGIRAVLERPDRGEALGLAARAAAEQDHGWERRAELILDRLAQVGMGRSRG